MKRMKVLIGKRRMMVVATLAILVLAAAALVASSASFTASSANPGNMFTARQRCIISQRRARHSLGHPRTSGQDEARRHHKRHRNHQEHRRRPRHLLPSAPALERYRPTAPRSPSS